MIDGGAGASAARATTSTGDHDDDLVQGIVLMRKGENPGAVIEGVRAKIESVQALLPPGVTLRPYYSRDRLVRPQSRP